MLCLAMAFASQEGIPLSILLSTYPWVNFDLTYDMPHQTGQDIKPLHLRATERAMYCSPRGAVCKNSAHMRVQPLI
jgi:hypothetical protein